MIAGVFSVPPWHLSYIGGVCVWGSFLSLPQLTSSALYSFRILDRSWFSVSSLEPGGLCLLASQGTGWACYYLVSKLCPSLYDPMQYSQPGSCVHGIFQSRILEWVAISFSTEDASIWDEDVQTETIVWCNIYGEIVEIGCNCIRQNFMNHYYAFQTEPWKHCVVFFAFSL